MHRPTKMFLFKTGGNILLALHECFSYYFRQTSKEELKFQDWNLDPRPTQKCPVLCFVSMSASSKRQWKNEKKIVDQWRTIQDRICTPKFSQLAENTQKQVGEGGWTPKPAPALWDTLHALVDTGQEKSFSMALATQKANNWRSWCGKKVSLPIIWPTTWSFHTGITKRHSMRPRVNSVWWKFNYRRCNSVKSGMLRCSWTYLLWSKYLIWRCSSLLWIVGPFQASTLTTKEIRSDLKVT